MEPFDSDLVRSFVALFFFNTEDAIRFFWPPPIDPIAVPFDSARLPFNPIEVALFFSAVPFDLTPLPEAAVAAVVAIAVVAAAPLSTSSSSSMGLYKHTGQIATAFSLTTVQFGHVQ